MLLDWSIKWPQIQNFHLTYYLFTNAKYVVPKQYSSAAMSTFSITIHPFTNKKKVMLYALAKTDKNI